MTTTRHEAIVAYLQQIQPRDLADLMIHVQHDMLMLVRSFASYLELLEANLSRTAFPDAVLEDFHLYFECLHNTIKQFHDIMNFYSANASSMTAQELLGCFLHDVRNPIGTCIGYTALIEYDFRANPSSSISYQRAQHLLDATQATTERMKVIGNACSEYSHQL